MESVILTGAAGFIGAALAAELLRRGYRVYGADNLNSYYSPALKERRLEPLLAHPEFRFRKLSIEDAAAVDAWMDEAFAAGEVRAVVNLAAQAGVRYSLENPRAYIESNVVGFFNVMDACVRHHARHLIYASSSSVYGLNRAVPFRESDKTDRPASLYAATKKADELLAHAYSHLHGLPVSGLRFFTVYGPAGRPDMAPWLFTQAIMKGEPVKVFNHGDLERDFTYIGDVVEAVCAVVAGDVPEKRDGARCQTLNVGNSQPVRLMDFISEVERACGRKARLEMMPMQPGDVAVTYADSSLLQQKYGVRPATPLRQGIETTVKWMLEEFDRI